VSPPVLGLPAYVTQLERCETHGLENVLQRHCVDNFDHVVESRLHSVDSLVDLLIGKDAP
jgi:hypothetical protein